jgi:hypothetical protein
MAMAAKLKAKEEERKKLEEKMAVSELIASRMPVI